jgi:molybdate transport system ATP-binding protein
MSLRVEIRKQYKDFCLEVCFDNKGKAMGLLGASGCGKSLTLKCIAGIETPDQGKIILNDRVLFDSENRINLPVQQRRTGLLFQSYALFPNMSVRENIRIGVRNKAKEKALIDTYVSMLRLERVLDQYPHQISGGEQQRVAIARMLVNEPEVMMFDEPFSALDSYLKHKLELELGEALKSCQGDLVMVSHNREELYTFCDAIAVVRQGKIIEFGPKAGVFHKPFHLSTARLTGCKNISRARKKSDYVVEALDWRILLQTDQRVEDNISYVGIRAHDVLPSVSPRSENVVPVTLLRLSEGTHEFQLFLQNSEWGAARFSWMVSCHDWIKLYQEKAPRYISMPRERLLLLKDDNVN